MSFFTLVKRNYQAKYPKPVAKNPTALRFGILGAAKIASQAFILPAVSHPDVVIAAVASRDEKKCTAFAKKHSIVKVYYGGDAYQRLLDDPTIDAIYNPFPNGLHYEWTIKALAAGKHVLLEKPSSDNQEDTVKMFRFAEQKGLILLEAFHYRFHPSIQRVKAIVDSGELGPIKSIKAELCVPGGLIPFDDIRYKYELGGGGFMDGGGYVINCARYLTSSNPIRVVSAKPTSIYNPDPRIDNGINAILEFPGNLLADVTCNIQLASCGPFGLIPSLPRLGVTAECEFGSIRLNVFPIPHVFHSINVKPRSGKTRVEKLYTHPTGEKRGEAFWSTYRYQLEAFVDEVRGRKPQTWVTAQDSIDNLKWLEAVYDKSGLSARPGSSFVWKTDGGEEF